jgi:hypothetical protein
LLRLAVLKGQSEVRAGKVAELLRRFLLREERAVDSVNNRQQLAAKDGLFHRAFQVAKLDPIIRRHSCHIRVAALDQWLADSLPQSAVKAVRLQTPDLGHRLFKINLLQ